MILKIYVGVSLFVKGERFSETFIDHAYKSTLFSKPTTSLFSYNSLYNENYLSYNYTKNYGISESFSNDI